MFSDIRLQWEPDVFGDDMWVIHMAFEKQELTASDCWCRGSDRCARSPSDLCQPPVSRHATDDNLKHSVIPPFFGSCLPVAYVCHLSFAFVLFQDSLQDWATKEADCL